MTEMETATYCVHVKRKTTEISVEKKRNVKHVIHVKGLVQNFE